MKHVSTYSFQKFEVGSQAASWLIFELVPLSALFNEAEE